MDVGVGGGEWGWVYECGCLGVCSGFWYVWVLDVCVGGCWVWVDGRYDEVGGYRWVGKYRWAGSCEGVWVGRCGWMGIGG